MSNGSPTPTASTLNRYFLCEWLACLKEITHFSRLSEEGKFLWLWLVAQSVDYLPFHSPFSYEQIANAMGKTPEVIHRLLFELLAMGLLSADLPICFGQLTPEMIQQERDMRLRLPPKRLYSTRHIDI